MSAIVGVAGLALGFIASSGAAFSLSASLFAAREGVDPHARAVSFFFAGVAAAVAAIAWYGSAPVVFWRYRHIPGARGKWLIGSLYELKDLGSGGKEGKEPGGRTRILADVYREHMQRHGKIFKFMFGRRAPMVVVVDPEAVQDLGMRQFSKAQDRPSMGSSYATAAGRDGEARERIEKGLLFARGGFWRGIRNALLPMFHSEVLAHFAPVMHDAGDTLVGKLTAAEDGATVNIHNMFGGYTQEIIGTSVFGRHFESQAVPESFGSTTAAAPERSSLDGPLNEAVYRAVATIFANSAGDLNALLSLLCPVLRPFMQLLSDLFPTERTLKVRKAIAVMSRVGEAMLRDAKGAGGAEGKGGEGEPLGPSMCAPASPGEEKKVCFMDKMLSARDRDTGKPLSENEIIAQSTTFIAGGTETTASTLSYAVYLVSQHPEVQARMVEEVDAFESGEPSFSQIMEGFPYLQAVIYETLRLYPSGGFVSRITNAPVKVGGYDLPVGTAVIVPLVLLHALPEHFPDPEKFKPERFLGQPTWHKCAYIPFGIGQRKCIGYRLAMAEATLALFKLYRKCTFQVSPLTPTPHLPLMQGITLQPKDGVCVTVRHRARRTPEAT